MLREGCRQEKRCGCQWWAAAVLAVRVGGSRPPAGFAKQAFSGKGREMTNHTHEHAGEQIKERRRNAAYMQPMSKRERAGLVRLKKGREIALRVRYLAVHFKCRNVMQRFRRLRRRQRRRRQRRRQTKHHDEGRRGALVRRFKTQTRTPLRVLHNVEPNSSLNAIKREHP